VGSLSLKEEPVPREQGEGAFRVRHEQEHCRESAERSVRARHGNEKQGCFQAIQGGEVGLG